MKGIITVGYKRLVMDLEDAVLLMKALGEAERYELNWRSADDGGSTHHIYPCDTEELTLVTMSDDLYRMAKLAGKPTKK
jgi:hypothetical protein